MLENEVWKDAKYYEGKYQISNYGRVWSIRSQKILSPLWSKGYAFYKLYSKNGKVKTEQAHRLVAIAFIPNPEKLPQVNHKDENPANNYVDNLEWCTAKYNCNYGHHKENCSKSMKGKMIGEKNPMYGKHQSEETQKKMRLARNNWTDEQKQKVHDATRKKNAVTVNQYLIDGTYVKTWECIADIQKELNIFATSICACCRGKYKIIGGYIWKYAKDVQEVA